jgi:hypothetical protein
MNRNVTAAALLFLLCGSAQAEWVKQGATADDIKRDQSECDLKARADTSFNGPQPMRGAGQFSGARSANNMVRENQSSRLCMKSKGYADPAEK